VIGAFVFICCGNVGAQTISSVKGTVIDENKIAVPGVEVSLKDSAGVTHSTFTDTLGHFALSPVPSGAAQISFSKPGFFFIENKAID
jgi:hypothetical protein